MSHSQHPLTSCPRQPWRKSISILADNPHLLTIQPDLSTTTTTYQGSLCSRQDGPGPKFQLTNGHLLSPLGTGRHTLHLSSPASEAEDLVSRLSAQNFFRSLPRGTSNMAYGTFNFLGGRLMIPNTGEKDSRVEPPCPGLGCWKLKTQPDSSRRLTAPPHTHPNFLLCCSASSQGLIRVGKERGYIGENGEWGYQVYGQWTTFYPASLCGRVPGSGCW